MTVTMFIALFTLGSAASSLLTEAAKKAFKISSNILALIGAAVVGIFGTAAAYIFLGIPFDLKNVVCMILMTVCIWVGSMVGYDKVLQTITQIKE